MGQQQVFIAVVCVIVVGAAIGAAFVIMTDHAYNNNRSSLAAEMHLYIKQLENYWNTSSDLGGANHLNANITVAKVVTFLGFNASTNNFTSANGQFRVISATTSGSSIVLTLKAIGTSKKGSKYPMVTTKIQFTQGSSSAPVVKTVLSDASAL